MKWIVPILAIVAWSTLFVWLGAQSPVPAQQAPLETRFPKDLADKMIRLYELRLEAAKIDLELEEVNFMHWSEKIATDERLVRVGAESPSNFKNTRLAYNRAKLELRMSQNFVKEVEAQIDVMKAGFQTGTVKIGDVYISAEPRQRRQ